MISDGDGARAVARWIMGGAERNFLFHENVLIECAWFEPLPSAAAARFLIDTELPRASARRRSGNGRTGLRRAAELVLQLCRRRIASGVSIFMQSARRKKLRVTRAEILRVMGADVPDKE